MQRTRHATFFANGTTQPEDRKAMSTQGALFGAQPVGRKPAPFPPPNVADTSRAAAESIKPDAAAIRNRIRLVIGKRGPRGATCDEIEQIMSLRHQTASARINELRVLGVIVDSTERRETTSGRKAIVWVHAEPCAW